MTPAMTQDHERARREAAMRAFWAEIDRQCGLGAGMAQTCAETGLFQINADVDPFAMADAMLAFAAAETAALKARVAELEAENARLRSAPCSHDRLMRMTADADAVHTAVEELLAALTEGTQHDAG